jgi:O-antigen ligase
MGKCNIQAFKNYEKIILKNAIIDRYQYIQFIMLGALCTFPIAPRGLESVLMLALMLLSVFYFFIEGKFYWNSDKTKKLLFLSSVFIILVLSALYSDNFKISLKYIQKLAPIILLPFVFLVYKNALISKENLEKLLTFYIISLALMLLSLNIYSFNSLYINGLNSWDLRNEFEAFTDVHGTYLTMWLGLGILIIAYKAKSFGKTKVGLFFGILTLIYFIYWLFIIGARMPILATFITILVFFLRINKLSLIKVTALFFFIALTSLVFFNNYVNSTYHSIINYKSAFPVGKYEVNFAKISNENIRSGIYYCSIKTITANPIFGIGIGDVDDALQFCFDNNYSYTDVYSIKKYNSHSQYLLILLATGVTGFFLFVISLFYLFKVALKKSSPLYFCFMVFVLLCFSFENILSRHDGIIFFSLMNSILFFAEEKDTVNKQLVL